MNGKITQLVENPSASEESEVDMYQKINKPSVRKVTKAYFLANAAEVVRDSRNQPIEVIDENGRRISGMCRVTLEEEPLSIREGDSE